MNLLAILGVTFGGACVWLTVRIVNRKERWAKWTLAGVAVPVLYLARFGPACRLAGNRRLPIESAFLPIARLMVDGPQPVRRAIVGYASICGGEPAALRLQHDLWLEKWEDAHESSYRETAENAALAIKTIEETTAKIEKMLETETDDGWRLNLGLDLRRDKNRMLLQVPRVKRMKEEAEETLRRIAARKGLKDRANNCKPSAGTARKSK